MTNCWRYFLRFRRILLTGTILVLISGLFLFAISTVRENHASSQTSWYNAPVQSGTFSYGGVTLPLNPSTTTIVGTSGIADLMILTIPYQNFSEWVCHFVPSSDTYSRCVPYGGNYFNITVLYSYLQTNQSQLAYSQTIVNENITLGSIAYHVTNPTSVTIVLAHMGSGWVRDYGQTTITNQTVSYPLIGYTERYGTPSILTGVYLGLIISGTAGLALLRSKFEPSHQVEPSQGTTIQACPQCGGQNLFFAKQCTHCGKPLGYEVTRAELVSR